MTEGHSFDAAVGEAIHGIIIIIIIDVAISGSGEHGKLRREGGDENIVLVALWLVLALRLN